MHTLAPHLLNPVNKRQLFLASRSVRHTDTHSVEPPFHPVAEGTSDCDVSIKNETKGIKTRKDVERRALEGGGGGAGGGGGG